MKATGIVRRIDDLGRVVIPKEIRRTMRIREGDPLEIYTDREGEVIFKKYSPIGELTSFASQYAETLHKVCNLSVVIADRDAVIACSGLSKKDYIEKRLSPEIEKIMENRSIYTYQDENQPISVISDASDGFFCICSAPIITAGDVIGTVSAMHDSNLNQPIKDLETTIKLISTAANFLSKQLDE